MIIRSNKDKWVTADTVWVKDSTLSAKARGILIYLLSLPDDWDLHIAELVTHFTDGEKSIRAGMKELTDKGYVFVIPRRDSDNRKFVGNDYVIMEDPREELRHAENGDAQKGALLSTKERPNTNKTIVDLSNYEEPIKVLNDLTGRNFNYKNVTNLGRIKARVKDGSSVEEIVEVIKFICKQRMGTKFEMYLRPSTIFKRNKYEEYKEEYKYLESNGKRTDGVLRDLN